jgi:hypothetical protein
MTKPKTPLSKPKASKSKTAVVISRRDATGHLSRKYARDLLGESGTKRARDVGAGAFIPRSRTVDELGEELGEAFLQSATSGEEAEPERHERVVTEEQGGPFVPSKAVTEFARGPDAADVEGSTREPLPKTSKADP